MESRDKTTNPKGDGLPYVEKFNKEYERMTTEEKIKFDALRAELYEILGLDDE